jgi:hemoglobin
MAVGGILPPNPAEVTVMRARVLGGVLLAAAVATAARADDAPLERSDLDRRVVKVVYESALQGTEIYNKGNYEGCYRLYQGTLMALQPLLDHRPKLQASVLLRLQRAEGMKPTEGAFELRAALDEIQNEIAPSPKKTPLWDRLGGEEKVRKAVHEFLMTTIENPKVNLTRDKTVKVDLKKYEEALVQLISVNTGGPLKYTAEDLKKAHAGMKITAAEFDAYLADMEAAFKKVEVPDAEVKELIATLNLARSLIVEDKN